MKKKFDVVGLLFCVSISIFSLSLYTRYQDNIENNLLSSSLDIGTAVKKFYEGDDFLNQLNENKVIDLKVISKLNSYNKELKALNNTELNLTKYYDIVFKNTNIEASEGTPVIDDDVNKSIDNSAFDETIDNDKRIYSKNGQDFIKSNDIELLDNSYGTLAYHNKWLIIPENQIPLTYNKIINCPDYKYKLKTYDNKKNKCFKIVYVSKLDISNTLVVEVYNNGRKIVDVKISDNL